MTAPERVKALVAEGKSHREIATLTGLSLSTISKYRNRPTVPEEYSPDSSETHMSGEELFRRWAADNRELSKKREEFPHDLVCLRLPDEPTLVVHGSDWHLGPKGTDHHRLWSDLAGVAQVGGYLLLGGDLIDNPIKHRSHTIHSTTTPGEQIRALRFLLTAASDAGVKIVGGCSGNHEAWTDKEAGIDVCGPMFRELGVPYSPHQLRVVFHIGGSETRILLRHKYRFRSQFDLAAQFRRMWDEGAWDFDIGMLGHTHDGPVALPFIKHGVERWASLAGSYKIIDSYGEEGGFNPARTGMTSFVIEPDGRIHGFNDLRSATIFLRGLKNA